MLLDTPLSSWTVETTLSGNLHSALQKKKKESLLHGTEDEELIVLTALLNSLKAAQLLNVGPDDSRPWFCGYKPRIWSPNSHSKV